MNICMKESASEYQGQLLTLGEIRMIQESKYYQKPSFWVKNEQYLYSNIVNAASLIKNITILEGSEREVQGGTMQPHPHLH